LSRGNGEMLLVVDDEAPILAITSRTLQAFGYQILKPKIARTHPTKEVSVMAWIEDEDQKVLMVRQAL
jgi:hypothetical protein